MLSLSVGFFFSLLPGSWKQSALRPRSGEGLMIAGGGVGGPGPPMGEAAQVSVEIGVTAGCGAQP